MTRQNDLRTETDVQYFFGEIKLWREAVPKNSLGIIVEAKSDEKLFRKLVNSKTTFFSVDGWTKAIDTLKLCENNEIVGVLSIIDADFKRILVSTELSENLFFTDFHDKEIMMAHSQAWLEVLNSFGEPQKILRQELGFTGMIVSDDLSMEGASTAGGIPERAVAALAAGCDMVLLCQNPAGQDQLLDSLASTPVAVPERIERLRRRGGRDFRKSVAYREALEALRDVP